MPAPLVRSEGTDSANKRNRWTPEEVELLGKIVVEGEGSRKAAIMNASSRGDDRDLRRAAWISVANEFNEKAIDLPEGFSGFRKSADQVKKKWSSTKSEAKNSFAAAKAATMATGGGRAGVKDIHQNFLLGLTDTELQGFTTESFGSVNLNAAEAVAATVNLDEENGVVQENPATANDAGTVIEVVKNHGDDNKPQQSSSASSFPPPLPKPSRGSKWQPPVKAAGRKRNSNTKSLEDRMLLEELKTAKLRRKVLRLKSLFFATKLGNMGVDLPDESEAESSSDL